jgi:hypothetical protein
LKAIKTLGIQEVEYSKEERSSMPEATIKELNVAMPSSFLS